MDKKALRRQIGALKKAMTAEEIERYSAELTEKFLKLPAYREARSVYGYLPYNQEVRTVPLLRQAQRDGKRVAVPKVFGEEMRFIWLDDLNAVAEGYCRIPEPLADGPEADDHRALVLMPGLAFDPSGRRMGYGGGFYDRFLAAEPEHPTVALCYGFQMLPFLDTEDHDIPVDTVLWSDYMPAEFQLLPWEETYIPHIVRWADDPRIAGNLRDAFPSPYTEADAAWFVRDCIEREPAQLCRAIVMDGEAVGCVSVQPQSDVYRRSGELGYWLARPYWGKGIMTAAVGRICAEAFRRFDLLRIYAQPYARNTGSRRVLEKNGFRMEGLLRQSVVKNGAIEDTSLYALLREDWEKR